MIIASRKKRKVSVSWRLIREPKRIWLCVALLGLALLGFSFTAQSNDASVITSNSLLYPELKAHMNIIRTVHILHNTGEFRITHHNGQWRVADYHNFPAQFGLVRHVVMTLANAEVIEPKTTRRALFHHLDVQDVDRPDSNAVQVRLLANDDSVVANVIIGKTESTPSGQPLRHTYVRKVGQDQALLISGVFTLPRQALDWIERDVLHLDGDRVQTVSFSPFGEDEDHMILSRDTPFERDFRLTPHKPVKTSLAQPIINALAYTRFQDVLPMSNLDDVKPQRIVTYTTFDGMIIRASVYEFEENKWVTFNASWQAAPSPETWLLKAPQGYRQGLSLRDPTTVSADVQRFNEVFKGWAFGIDPIKIERLLTTKASLSLRDS